MLIAVVNHDPDLPNEHLLHVLRAVSRQVFHDFTPIWNLSATLRLAGSRGTGGPPVERYEYGLSQAAPQLDPVAGGAVIFVQKWGAGLPDRYRDLPYCYGFHDMEPGDHFPVGYVFTTAEGDRNRPAEFHWSVTLSHEVLELIANPHVNLLVPAPHPGQHVRESVYFEREVCDPVRQSCYPVDNVLVSNFVLPPYFICPPSIALPPDGSHRAGHRERLDFLDNPGSELRPFGLLNGGYLRFREHRKPAPQMYWRDAGGAYHAPTAPPRVPGHHALPTDRKARRRRLGAVRSATPK
ncbi:hypothetical protein R5W23_005128 [Gemmata sp. JC673]|uniref:DUF2169 domain-containing protein n=1 Tax=Gemmata algarum TaxID=2975278 RepID=A0ABU5FCH2_9BACT|nr:hypothetical protein [Gemmata algarum]MDY3563516.1 hypothetical protein [Gemmata algarum]